MSLPAVLSDTPVHTIPFPYEWKPQPLPILSLTLPGSFLSQLHLFPAQHPGLPGTPRVRVPPPHCPSPYSSGKVLCERQPFPSSLSCHLPASLTHSLSTSFFTVTKIVIVCNDRRVSLYRIVFSQISAQFLFRPSGASRLLSAIYLSCRFNTAACFCSHQHWGYFCFYPAVHFP